MFSSVSVVAAWSTLCVVFACAWVYGNEFASTKESATVWGGVIGLAAFFAWLAVLEDDAADHDDDAAGDAGSAALQDERDAIRKPHYD